MNKAQIGSSLEVANQMNNLGMLNFNLGNHREAIKNLLESLDMYGEIQPSD